MAVPSWGNSEEHMPVNHVVSRRTIDFPGHDRPFGNGLVTGWMISRLEVMTRQLEVAARRHEMGSDATPGATQDEQDTVRAAVCLGLRPRIN